MTIRKPERGPGWSIAGEGNVLSQGREEPPSLLDEVVFRQGAFGGTGGVERARGVPQLREGATGEAEGGGGVV